VKNPTNSINLCPRPKRKYFYGYDSISNSIDFNFSQNTLPLINKNHSKINFIDNNKYNTLNINRNILKEFKTEITEKGDNNISLSKILSQKEFDLKNSFYQIYLRNKGRLNKNQNQIKKHAN